MQPLTTVILVAMVAWAAYVGPDYFSVDAKKNSNRDEENMVKQNFKDMCRIAVLKNIRFSFDSFYLYESMSNYFDRADIALPGLSALFRKYAEDELRNARLLMQYLNKRGQTFELRSIREPEIQNWRDGLSAFQTAIEKEKATNLEFIHTTQMAVQKKDPHLKQFIEDAFLGQKIVRIKELGDYIAQLRRILNDRNSGLGLYVFDRTIS